MAGNGDLVPLPVSYEEREGAFHFGRETSIVAPSELSREAGVLAGWLSSVEGMGKVSVAHLGEAERAAGEAEARKVAPAGAGPRNAGTSRGSVIRLSLLPDTGRGAPHPRGAGD